jgi:ribonucleoside-diphosphate reductase alpha chain
VPLEDYVRKFSHMRFEPQGYTKNPDIRIAKSLIDYIFRWLGITFLAGYKEASMGILPAGMKEGDDSSASGSANDLPVADDSAIGLPTMTAKKPAAGGRKESKPATKPRPTVAEGGSASSATATSVNQKSPSPKSQANGHSTNGNGHANTTATATATMDVSAKVLARAGVMLKGADGPNTARSELFADFQSDAPACDNCGAITVRNGNCYLCHNCGSSMGCS